MHRAENECMTILKVSLHLIEFLKMIYAELSKHETIIQKARFNNSPKCSISIYNDDFGYTPLI